MLASVNSVNPDDRAKCPGRQGVRDRRCWAAFRTKFVTLLTLMFLKVMLRTSVHFSMSPATGSFTENAFRDQVNANEGR